jgi:hypothetical protein
MLQRWEEWEGDPAGSGDAGRDIIKPVSKPKGQLQSEK